MRATTGRSQDTRPLFRCTFQLYSKHVQTSVLRCYFPSTSAMLYEHLTRNKERVCIVTAGKTAGRLTAAPYNTRLSVTNQRSVVRRRQCLELVQLGLEKRSSPSCVGTVQWKRDISVLNGPMSKKIMALFLYSVSARLRSPHLALVPSSCFSITVQFNWVLKSQCRLRKTDATVFLP